MKYLILKQALFENISGHYNQIKSYFSEINNRISVKFELDTICISLSKTDGRQLIEVLKSEFTNNFTGLNLIKNAVNDGFKVKYGELTLTGTLLNDILDNGFNYSSIIAKEINGSDIKYWLLLYYPIVATKEDLQLLWHLIDSNKHLSIIRYLMTHNNDNFETGTDCYYIVELSYGTWMELRKKFEGLPIRFIKNMDASYEDDVKTSRPDEKYHGFIICPEGYIKYLYEIFKNIPEHKMTRSGKEVEVYKIIDPIKMERRKPTNFIPLNYNGCYDKLKAALNLPDMTNAEGMIDMGFND